MPLAHGFVALVDVLGFKGIWDEGDPDSILSGMKRLAKLLDEEQKAYEIYFQTYFKNPPLMKVALLSDTVVIGLGFESNAPEEGNDQWRYAFSVLGYMLYHVIHHWAQCETPKPVRGCVAAGNFAIEDNFLIGSAVDEAAEYFEKANGAFIWLLESARVQSLLAQEESDLIGLGSIYWRKWNVPMKDGARDTFTLDMFNSRSGAKYKWADPTEKILGSMDITKPGVAKKLAATHELIEFCRKYNLTAYRED